MMTHVYTLRATALCPIGEGRDHYDVRVESNEMIEIGELRKHFDGYANVKMYQEEIAAAASESLGAFVLLSGEHPAPVTITTRGIA